ncbi:MAG: dihydropyrimidinase [Hyphomicrobiales bacterium]|nr:dihydropyrimidinase [Hyphomicrobiales bacterium]
MSVLIRGGTIVNEDGSSRADIRVRGGIIGEVASYIAPAAGERIIDAGGCLVMPGGIDPHTHLDYPFMATRTADDFFSGTSAALAGGTTAILDFIFPENGQPLRDACVEWHRRARPSVADYGFHIAVTRWDDQTESELRDLVDREGITSFKHFMAYKGGTMVGDDVLIKSFALAAKLGVLCLVHAENGDLVHYLQQKFVAEGKLGPEFHPLSRPPEVEGEAVNRAICIAEAVGARLYVVHNSCIPAIEALRRGQMRGVDVTGEALACHLAISDEVYRDCDWVFAAAHVMSPPFRPPEHQEALWAALASGVIKTTGTDHAGFRAEDRLLGRSKFTDIPNGTGSIEDRLHVLWHLGVNSGRLTPEQFVRVTSSAAARAFGLYPKKGLLAEGGDADIIIWDPAGERTIRAADQHQRTDFNLFEGMRVRGINRMTISRGDVVFEEGELSAREGRGEYLPRSANPRAA